MSDPRLLTESGWKSVSVKFKISKPDLQRKLAEYDKLGDEDHDDCLDVLADIKKLAADLKKSKDIAAAPEVAKYLASLLSAADGEQREVSKDKEKSEKDKKAEDAAAKKKEAEKEDEGEDEDNEDEEEEGAYQEKLVLALKRLKGSKDVTYQFIVCDGKPPAIMVAKRITPKHRTELTTVTNGSKRFLHLGECRFEEGRYVFEMEKPVAGLARKLQESLKYHTGKRHPIKVGTEQVDEDDDGGHRGSENQDGADEHEGQEGQEGEQDQDSGQSTGGDGAEGEAGAQGADAGETPVNMTRPFEISASVGQGGKNKPEDVQAVQIALNKKNKAGLNVDGKSGSKTIAAIAAFQRAMGMGKPDGRVDPGRGTARALGSAGALPKPPGPPQPIAPPKLPKPELAKAPQIWHSTRNIIEKNITELKKAVRGHYAHEHPDLVSEIDKNISKLDAIMDSIDKELADGLQKAYAAKNDAAREAEMKNCKNILAEHIKYVKSEPLIAHIDSNPFGVDTKIKQVLSDAFMHVAQAMATKKN